MRVPFLYLLILSLSFACSSDTGILIRTTASEGFDPEIASLRYYVGERTINNARSYSDGDPLEDIQLDGRDLSKRPYKLLLRPKDTETTDPILVAVLALDAQNTPVGFGRLPAPLRFVDGSVLEWELTIGAMPSDVWVTENDCLKWQRSSGEVTQIGRAGDEDCDGYLATDGDCDDLDPNRSPGQPEDCNNKIDDNCNDLIDALDTADFDDDGFGACGPDGPVDCNDDDRNIYPGAEELCDGKDNNCDGSCDEDFDGDGDSITAPCGSVLEGDKCIAMGDVDCDDDNERVYPGHPEICDGLDNDCSDGCDNDEALDPDKDGYTVCGSILNQCGVHSFWEDCAPDDPRTHPGAQELCDNTDNDCDGVVDPELTPCYAGVPGGCAEGFSQCQQGVVGECLFDDQDPSLAPASWCSLYTSCTDEGLVSDAFTCNLDDVIDKDPTETCRVNLQDTQMCDGNRVEVNPNSTAIANDACSYFLLAGELQQGYQMNLAGLNGDLDPLQVQGCSSQFAVQVPDGLWPGDAMATILFTDSDGQSKEIHVKLEAQRVESCEGVAGLECDTWSPALMPLPL